ncbi:MAG: hypothetical protein IJ247_00115 [Bacilli bacterium]|nr:hypothetical protein [Bacilli bacterium]
MFILKAIGSLFVKLWRWIKETAWVQPLLIVGAIFALIFSIPSITSWVGSWDFSTENSYYLSKKLTLESEGDDDTSSSAADVFTNSLYKNTLAAYEGRYDDIDLGDQEQEKYFLLFVGENCDPCKKAEEGFKELDENWGSIYRPSDGNKLAIHTIFSDEESSTDSKYSNTTGDTAFQRYLLIHSLFFNETSEWLSTNTPYKGNNGVSDDSYMNYGAPNTEDFTVPAVLLVDYTKEAQEQGRAGVSEIIFSVSGDSKQAKANNLLNMWNHTDTGAAGIKNPFCLNYMK